MIFSNSETRQRSLAAVGIAVLALALFLTRFGYDYGISDQEEFVPAVVHMNDDAAFSTDWFVTTQAEQISVRTPTVFVLYVLTRLVSIETALALLYTLSFTALAISIFLLSMLFGANRLLSGAAVIVALVLTPQWTIGGNDLAQSIVTPSMIAWSIGLAGFVAFLSGRRIMGAVALGIAAYFQPLVSLQLSGVLLISSLVSDWLSGTIDYRTLGRLAVAYLVYAVVAGPFIFLLATSHHQSVESTAIFETLAHLRAPHHYIFSSFPLRNIALFILLLGSGFVFLVVTGSPYRYFGLAVLGTVLGLCLIGFVFTELIPSLLILKLQLFKSSVIAKTVSIAAGAGWISHVRVLRFGHTVSSGATNSRGNANRFATLCAITGITLIALQAFLTPRTLLPGRARVVDGMASLERWVQRETPTSSVFLIPPSNSRFRISTNRSIVINFKAFPFQDDAILEWRKRMEAIAGPIPRTGDTGERLGAMDAAYEALSPQALIDLQHEYNVGYVVRKFPLDRTDQRFELSFVSHDGWRVYRINGVSA
ncbi:MAG: hypothetical protein HKN43_10050 [Rhodothermales bacterium]|nr:hypothetical protein [Rhodothermales bacterium]